MVATPISNASRRYGTPTLLLFSFFALALWSDLNNSWANNYNNKNDNYGSYYLRGAEARNCGTMEHHNHLIEQHPDMIPRMEVLII